MTEPLEPWISQVAQAIGCEQPSAYLQRQDLSAGRGRRDGRRRGASFAGDQRAGSVRRSGKSLVPRNAARRVHGRLHCAFISSHCARFEIHVDSSFLRSRRDARSSRSFNSIHAFRCPSHAHRTTGGAGRARAPAPAEGGADLFRHELPQGSVNARCPNRNRVLKNSVVEFSGC